ncbi:DUF3576 domain-containing protein [bacterium]|nr:DUF3576 domain-containing protein [bacterium]
MTFRLAAAVLTAGALGLGGCSIFGSSTATSAPSNSTAVTRDETGGIGVNSFLWRASLDTLSFMPLVSADPWGGVIITDWYANPEKPDERFKVTVYILDTRLRADGLAANVSRETRVDGQWASATVAADTNIAIENAILTRARELRLSADEG